VVDSLKALDPEGPIREADIAVALRHVRFVPRADIYSLGRTDGGAQRRADELRQSD
jgi:hypothetical protein